MSAEQQIQTLRGNLDKAEGDGRWDIADKLYVELRCLDPDPSLLHRHAIAVIRIGEYARAATILRRIVNLNDSDIEARSHLAEVYFLQKRFPDAKQHLTKILDADPDHIAALRRIGKIEHELDEYDAAEAHLRHLLSLVPDDVEGGLLLGSVLANDKKRYTEADPVFKHVLDIAPDSPSALHNYGLLKRFQGDLETADEYLSKACALYPNESDFAFSLGICKMFQEEMEAAHRWCIRAVELKPGNNAAQVYLGFSLFLMGKMREGWAQYEKRLDLAVLKEARYERPRWQGEDISGKPLLLITEQGMGDNIQFIRYVPMLIERGATVIVATHEALVDLFKTVDGLEHVMTAIPEPKYFYRYCPIMSLPYVFGTDEDTIPGDAPYLCAPEGVKEKWRARVASYEGLKVGLCWRGNSNHTNDYFRSSSLEQMKTLLQVDNVTFFCLSKKLPDYEQDMPARIVNIGAEFETFADVAGVMDALDLVITVDTAICHLAGALGRPVWTLIARGPDFRWGLRGETTPWYPTMKLYRQSVLGDWSGPLQKMVDDLGAMKANAAI